LLLGRAAARQKSLFESLVNTDFQAVARNGLHCEQHQSGVADPNINPLDSKVSTES
jgi:hypothetical protein